MGIWTIYPIQTHPKVPQIRVFDTYASRISSSMTHPVLQEGTPRLAVSVHIPNYRYIHYKSNAEPSYFNQLTYRLGPLSCNSGLFKTSAIIDAIS